MCKESPTKNKTSADTDFSPIKKTTKKNARKVLDDSDGEADQSVNDNKETKNDNEHVNGRATVSRDNDAKKSKEVTKNDSPKLSSPASIPRRKTGMFGVVHLVLCQNRM